MLYLLNVIHVSNHHLIHTFKYRNNKCYCTMLYCYEIGWYMYMYIYMYFELHLKSIHKHGLVQCMYQKKIAGRKANHPARLCNL